MLLVTSPSKLGKGALKERKTSLSLQPLKADGWRVIRLCRSKCLESSYVNCEIQRTTPSSSGTPIVLIDLLNLYAWQDMLFN